MHYYQFNIGDYRRDTSHLSRLEHSIYRDLIDWYYLDELPIPLETQSVSRRLRLGSESETKALQNVLSDFFQCTDDGFRHSRIDSDIKKYHHDCKKNKANGKKGGRPKALQNKEDNPVGYESVTSGNPTQTQLKGNQEPITKNQEPIKPIRAPEGFAEFWNAYPKKVGKGDAEKAFKTSRINGHLPDLLAAIENQKSSSQWQKDGGQYIPNPATWLRQRRWEDTVQTADLANTQFHDISPMLRGAL